jgi:hypothetical protein
MRAEASAGRIVRIDAACSRDEVHAQIDAALRARGW